MQGISGSPGYGKFSLLTGNRLKDSWSPLSAGAWWGRGGGRILWKVNKLRRRCVWAAFLGRGERRAAGGGAFWPASASWEASPCPPPICLHWPRPVFAKFSSPPPQGQCARKPRPSQAKTERQEGSPPGVTSDGESGDRRENDRAGRRRWGALKEAAGKRRGGVASEAGAQTGDGQSSGGAPAPCFLSLGSHAQPHSVGIRAEWVVLRPCTPRLPDSYPGTHPIQINAPMMPPLCISPSRVLLYTPVILCLGFNVFVSKCVTVEL